MDSPSHDFCINFGDDTSNDLIDRFTFQTPEEEKDNNDNECILSQIAPFISDNQNHNFTTDNTSQILTKHKTSREEQNKLEQIRAKNRESARRSRAKKTQDLILLLEQNNILKKENNNLKSKINLLCPTCKLLFSNDKIFKSQVTTSNTSTTTTNTNTMKNKFIIKSSSIFEFKDKENPAHKKIGAVVGIISLVCLISNIFSNSVNVKNYVYNLNHNLISKIRSLSQDNVNTFHQILLEEKYLLDQYSENSGPFIKYGDYRHLNKLKINNTSQQYIDLKKPFTIIDPLNNKENKTCDDYDDHCFVLLQQVKWRSEHFDNYSNAIMSYYIPLIDDLTDKIKYEDTS